MVKQTTRTGVVLLSSLLAIAPCSAQARPIDLVLARNYFDEIRNLSAADGGRLWGAIADLAHEDGASAANVAEALRYRPLVARR